MKSSIQKWLFLIAGLLVSLSASAYSFMVDGINYSVTSFSERTVEVTSSESCLGVVEIPSKVLYESIAYKVTSIGDWAFRGCTGCTGLTSVIIPTSVTTIENFAFSGCTGLTSMTIPNSVTSIGTDVFNGCVGLASIMVDSGNLKYDSRENCNAIIETATNTLKFGCKATTIPNSVTSIGDNAFSGCTGLTSIDIPNSVTSIGGAFYGCTGLTSVTIPNSVTSIGRSAFSGCTGLTSVTIGNSVTSIGASVFNGCTGLTSIIIPNSVTSIGNNAFLGCTGFTSVYCKATTPPAAPISIFDDVVLVNGTLYIPNGSLNSYEAVDPWRNFFNIKETDQFPDGGVDGIEADGINVVAKDGTIEVRGADGERVEVYSLSGQCVYSGMETRISVAKGIYIVHFAGTVHKMIL